MHCKSGNQGCLFYLNNSNSFYLQKIKKVCLPIKFGDTQHCKSNLKLKKVNRVYMYKSTNTNTSTCKLYLYSMPHIYLPKIFATSIKNQLLTQKTIHLSEANNFFPSSLLHGVNHYIIDHKNQIIHNYKGE